MGIVRRYEQSDEDWVSIEPLLPRQGRGEKWVDYRTVMNGMFRVLRSGSAWRDMPERYDKWPTVKNRFVRWRRDATLDRIAGTCASACTASDPLSGGCSAWTAPASARPR